MRHERAMSRIFGSLPFNVMWHSSNVFEGQSSVPKSSSEAVSRDLSLAWVTNDSWVREGRALPALEAILHAAFLVSKCVDCKGPDLFALP